MFAYTVRVSVKSILHVAVGLSVRIARGQEERAVQNMSLGIGGRLDSG